MVKFQESPDVWRDLATELQGEGFDFVLWTHTHGLSPESAHDEIWHFLRRAPVPVVSYHLDRWWGLEREHQVREPFFATDIVITADGGHNAEWAKNGTNHLWMPPAVLGEEAQIGERRADFVSDIAFVGSWQGGYHKEWAHRAQLVEKLKGKYRRRIQFWPKLGQHAVRGKDLQDLYASVDVVVGDSCLLNSPSRYSSDRVPETIGRGGFLLHPAVPGLIAKHDGERAGDETQYLSGEHLGTWEVGDWKGLFAKIDYWLENETERRSIAMEGRRHVLEHHTYEVRSRQIIEAVKELGL